MAVFIVTSDPTLEFGVEYNDQNGKANALYCDNRTGGPVWGWCKLENAQTFSMTFAPNAPGSPTRVNFPANVVTVQEVTNSDGDTYPWPVPVVAFMFRFQG